VIAILVDAEAREATQPIDGAVAPTAFART
jgi:hypothetical protein